MERPFFARLMTVLVVLLALLGTATAVVHFLSPHYNPGFDDHPGIVKSHVVLGALYLLLGLFQFSPGIRRQSIRYHRWMGRLLVAGALVTGMTALFLGIVIPFSGFAEQIIISIFGGLFLISIVQAVLNVRQGRIQQHREWMIRAYAIGASIVTMRLIFIPLLMINQPTRIEETAFYSIVAFGAAFVLHSALAEIWIRATRGRVVG